MTSIGSLFSGYGGLDRAAEAVSGGRTVWVSDIDPGACKILAYRYPDVPNIGDITDVAWDAVEPVDVVTAGFPCQDVSAAGKRAGLKRGTRSGLWHVTAEAIRHLRPSLVILENVRGLLTARGDEPTDELVAAWAEMGRWARVARLIESKANRAGREGKQEYVHRHQSDRVRIVGRHRRAVAAAKRADARIIRAIGTVLGTLADLGYDAAWHGLTASSVGAPHGRFRVFIIAWPAQDTDRATIGQRWQSAPGPDLHAADADDSGREGAQPTPGRDLPDGRATADAESHGRHEGRPEPAGLVGRLDAAVSGSGLDEFRAETTSNPIGGGLTGWPRDEIRSEVGRVATARSGQDADAHAADAHAEGNGRASEHDSASRQEGGGARGGVVADAHGDELRVQPVAIAGGGGEAQPANPVQWGQFEPAVRRWEHVLDRPAPSPTETSARGGQRLSPAFVEWMMGLPAGHVTDVPGLSRNEQLKALGNGVVPQQAEAALRYLLAALAVAA